MSSSHLDTKGICLLCLSENDKESRPPRKGSAGSSLAFTSLLRYLKINISEVFRTLKQFDDEPGAGQDLVVSLCSQCSAVTTQFYQLFLDFERIRMEMDRCCKKLHGLIQEGAMDFQRVTEFQRRMMTLIPTRGWEISEDGKIAEMLRKKTMEQCATQLHRVILKTPPTPSMVHAAKKSRPDVGTATFTNQTPLTTYDSTETVNREVVLDIRSNSSTFCGSSSSLGMGMTELVESRERLGDGKLSRTRELDLNPAELQSSGSACAVEVTRFVENQGEWFEAGTASGVKLTSFDGRKQTSSSSSLDRDTEQSFSRKIECVHCEKRFTRKSGLTEHLCNVHPMETFKERIPEGTTKDKFIATIESILQGRMENSSFACTLCGKVFRDKFHLKTHTLLNHFDEVHHRLLQDCGVPFPFRLEDGRQHLVGSRMSVQTTTSQHGWVEEDNEPTVINLSPEETKNEESYAIVDRVGMEKDPLDMG